MVTIFIHDIILIIKCDQKLIYILSSVKFMYNNVYAINYIISISGIHY